MDDGGPESIGGMFETDDDGECCECGDGTHDCQSCPVFGRDLTMPEDREVALNQVVYDTINGQWATKDSGERQHFDSGMQRDVTEGKIKWHLVASGPMLKRWAELMTRGAEKYDDDNWMKANSFDEYARFRQSAFRHFMQWYMGHEDEDHAAAVVFNMNGSEYVKERIT